MKERLMLELLKVKLISIVQGRFIFEKFFFLDHEEQATEDADEKKKRKRKRKQKEKNQQPSLTNVENTDHVMTVLPKLEWKRLRNKYLNLQRKNITHSKMKLHHFYEKQKEELKWNTVEEKTEDSKGNFLKNIMILHVQLFMK